MDEEAIPPRLYIFLPQLSALVHQGVGCCGARTQRVLYYPQAEGAAARNWGAL
jgi:hypothetical protein